MEMTDALVIGGGITGLTAAYLLKKKGLTVRLLEKANAVGGKIGTVHQDGFELDLGPATFRINAPLRELIQSLGLETELVYPDKKISRKRFIYSNQKLNPVGLNPVQLLGGSYLSWKSKKKIWQERSYKKGNEPKDESVASFVTRHFGEEVLQKLVEPVLTGIYAGDAHHLSVKSILPILKELEDKYGSVLKGFWNERKTMGAGGREIAAMRGGLQVMLQKLTDAIGKDGVITGCEVISITPGQEHSLVIARVNGEHREFRTKQLVLATPAHACAKLIDSYDPALARGLNSIVYNKVWQIHCTLPTNQFVPDIGFGFLMTPGSHKVLLGAVHGGALFAGKAAAGKDLITLFCGGSRWKEHHDPCEQAITDFKEIMGLKSRPEVLHIQEWPDAIPQPGVGHSEVLETVKAFEKAYPMVHIAGNYRSGVALGDCVKFCYENL